MRVRVSEEALHLLEQLHVTPHPRVHMPGRALATATATATAIGTSRTTTIAR